MADSSTTEFETDLVDDLSMFLGEAAGIAELIVNAQQCDKHPVGNDSVVFAAYNLHERALAFKKRPDGGVT